jgi:5'/3'-nucleotidase SurE
MQLPLPLALAVFPLAARAANIVLSNDDGWAEINIRSFYNALTAAGESVVLSAPAQDQSGTGKSTLAIFIVLPTITMH